MNNYPISKSELAILEILADREVKKEFSPKDIDLKLELGPEKVIDHFLDLEIKGFFRWVSLDLLSLNLERSTKEIYFEIYLSRAKLTKQGKHLMERFKSSQKAT